MAFFFCHRTATFPLFFYLNMQSSQKCHGPTPFRQNNRLKYHKPMTFENLLSFYYRMSFFRNRIIPKIEMRNVTNSEYPIHL